MPSYPPRGGSWRKRRRRCDRFNARWFTNRIAVWEGVSISGPYSKYEQSWHLKSQRKAREKPCLRCGYSLRKLPDAKHCPECGLSIWLSLNPNDSLDWSNPSWLRRMGIAAWVMALSQIIGFGAYTSMWRERPAPPIVTTADDGSTVVVPNPRTPQPHLVITSVSASLYLLIYNTSLLLMAGDEGRHPDRWFGYRWGCRIAAFLGLGIGLYLLVYASEFFFKLALFASAVTTFAYLRKLAQRIPNSLMVRVCGVVLFLPMLSLLKTFPIFWYLAAFQLFGVIEYLPWVYLPGSLFIIAWFAMVFQRDAKAAQIVWAKETAGEDRVAVASDL